MKQIKNLGDERQTTFCCYCGGDTKTRDHLPPKVFLDPPYPENLYVVGACEQCNHGFSLDEQYTACIIECARLCTIDLNSLERDKVIRILGNNPSLLQRIRESYIDIAEGTQFHIEYDRVNNIFMKLAQGHAVFDLNDPKLDQPDEFSTGLLSGLSNAEYRRFTSPSRLSLIPEIGSRAMLRVYIFEGMPHIEWITVQEGRYRYLVTVEHNIIVRLIFSEYLWFEAIWH